MAGESAQRVFEDGHAQRRERIQRTWGSIVVAVGLAFVLGWVLSIVVMSVALSMVESIGTGNGQTLSIHRPPSVLSLVSGGAFAVKRGHVVAGALTAGSGLAKGRGG